MKLIVSSVIGVVAQLTVCSLLPAYAENPPREGGDAQGQEMPPFVGSRPGVQQLLLERQAPSRAGDRPGEGSAARNQQKSQPGVSDACPTAETIEEKIINCGYNTVAADQAQQCLVLVVEQKQAALSRSSTAVTSSNREILAQAFRRLTTDINLMQNEAEIVANYTDAMIDVNDSRGAETSMDCFNTSFDRIQKVINQMDAAIEETMDRRDVIKARIGTIKK